MHFRCPGMPLEALRGSDHDDGPGGPNLIDFGTQLDNWPSSAKLGPTTAERVLCKKCPEFGRVRPKIGHVASPGPRRAKLDKRDQTSIKLGRGNGRLWSTPSRIWPNWAGWKQPKRCSAEVAPKKRLDSHPLLTEFVELGAEPPKCG